MTAFINKISLGPGGVERRAAQTTISLCLALCLATRVALIESFNFLVPLCCTKLVLPLFLYFLFFVSAAGGVGAMSMLPALEVGVESPLLEVGVTLLSLEMRAVLPSSLSLFESLPRRRRPDKASLRLVSIRRVPPITLIQSKEDKMEELEEHHSLNASVRLKARDFKLLRDFKIYLMIF